MRYVPMMRCDSRHTYTQPFLTQNQRPEPIVCHTESESRVCVAVPAQRLDAGRISCGRTEGSRRFRCCRRRRWDRGEHIDIGGQRSGSFRPNGGGDSIDGAFVQGQHGSRSNDGDDQLVRRCEQRIVARDGRHNVIAGTGRHGGHAGSGRRTHRVPAVDAAGGAGVSQFALRGAGGKRLRAHLFGGISAGARLRPQAGAVGAVARCVRVSKSIYVCNVCSEIEYVYIIQLA